MSLILSATGSIVSWTVGAVSSIALYGFVIGVVGFATKPNFQSFEPSFNSMRALGLETVKPKSRHVKDLGILIVVQSDMDVTTEVTSSLNETKTIDKKKVVTSVGLLNNWFHSDEYFLSGSTTHIKTS